MSIKNEEILGLIDSGSTKTYFGKKAANLAGDFEETDLRMKAANNNTIGIDGIAKINFNFSDISHVIPTRYIKSLNYDCIFGTDLLKTFGMWVDFGLGMCGFSGGDRGRLTSPIIPRDSHTWYRTPFRR